MSTQCRNDQDPITTNNLLFTFLRGEGGEESVQQTPKDVNIFWERHQTPTFQQTHFANTKLCEHKELNYSPSFLLFNAPLHDEPHGFVNVKRIFFKCYFGAICKSLSQYPHSVKDKCCDLGKGVCVSRLLFMRFSVPRHPPFDPGGITTCFRIIMTSMA